MNVVPVFIKKLYEIVSDNNISNIKWKSENSFIIYNPEKLVKNLEKKFKTTKIKSFVRQLHFYRFKKIGGTRYQNWIYFNKNFTKHGDELESIKRNTCTNIDDFIQRIETLEKDNISLEEQIGDLKKDNLLLGKKIKDMEENMPQRIEQKILFKFFKECDHENCFLSSIKATKYDNMLDPNMLDPNMLDSFLFATESEKKMDKNKLISFPGMKYDGAMLPEPSVQKKLNKNI